MRHIIASLVLSLLLVGCSHEQVAPQSQHGVSDNMTTSNQAAKGVSFSGEVVHITVEGSFWGVITDDAKKLNGELPKQFHQDGLRITGRYEVKEGMVSFRMWGELVEFIQIDVYSER